MALLSLQEAYSLSVLTYAAPALHLSVKQTMELKVCWNRLWFSVEYLGIINGRSVRAVIDGCGRLDVRHLILLCKIQFHSRIFIRIIIVCYINFSTAACRRSSTAASRMSCSSGRCSSSSTAACQVMGVIDLLL